MFTIATAGFSQARCSSRHQINSIKTLKE